VRGFTIGFFFTKTRKQLIKLADPLLFKNRIIFKQKFGRVLLAFFSFLNQRDKNSIFPTYVGMNRIFSAPAAAMPAFSPPTWG
jgi:hypothetical protein